MSASAIAASSSEPVKSPNSKGKADQPSADAKPVNKVVLVSIDGWGLSKEKNGNAILNAETPNMDKLSKEFLHTKLDASGLAVGLPAGVMGNRCGRQHIAQWQTA